MGVWLVTREDVKFSADMKETARNNAQVDRAIESASRSVEGFLRRTFAPVLATRYFNWPNQQYARAWRLWLDENDLISVTSVTSGGVALSASDYFLEPVNSGPPYDRVEIDMGSAAAFSSDDTWQRSIAITGTWGYSDDSTAVGTIVEALDASETGVDVDGASSSQLGVGSVLKVDSERMLVTNRTTLSTGQTLQADLDGLDSGVTVSVTDGTAFAVEETLLIDSERVRIVDISGSTLTVIRAWDGSTLAAHATGATIYAYRTLTVTRGALGTTAATHDSGAVVHRWDVPGQVRELAMAEALNNLEQANAAYARVSGQAERERDTTARGLVDLRKSVLRSHGRVGRVGAV
jgi:hypothetical protein